MRDLGNGIGQRARDAYERARVKLLQLSLVLLVLVGCEQNSAPPQKSGSPPAPVSVAPVTDEPMLVQRRYLGEVWAASDARLTVAEAGRVTEVHVVEGSEVKKGDLLVELDDRLARAQLSEAVAQKRRTEVQSGQAGRDAQRYALLEKERAVSELEAQQQESTAESLEAEKEGAAALVAARAEKVARHKLLAPFDGTITVRAVDPGDWLNPGELALQLLTQQRLEILVRVPPSLLDRIDDVDQISLRSDGRSVSGRLASHVGALDRETRTGLLRVEPQETPRWLRPGATVDVVFFLERPGALNVPADAVVHGAVGTRVMRLQDKEGALLAERIDVRVVESGGDRVLVEAEGLSPGDRVVVRGNERLRPGQSVTLKNVTVPAGGS